MRLATSVSIFMEGSGVVKAKILPLTERAQRSLGKGKLKDVTGSIANLWHSNITKWSASTDKHKANALSPGTSALKNVAAFLLAGNFDLETASTPLRSNPAAYSLQVSLPDNKATMLSRKKLAEADGKRLFAKLRGETEHNLSKMNVVVIARNSLDSVDDLLVALSNTGGVSHTVAVFDATSVDPSQVTFPHYGKRPMQHFSHWHLTNAWPSLPLYKPAHDVRESSRQNAGYDPKTPPNLPSLRHG